jgi:peptidoglycan/xylan/chitin deacetylase (PgdA/CDA1 family)
VASPPVLAASSLLPDDVRAVLGLPASRLGTAAPSAMRRTAAQVAAEYCLWPAFRAPRRADRRLAVSFDCDYPRDADAFAGILPVLKEAGTVATFACIGRWVESDRRSYRRLVDEGHEIVNHSMNHPYHPQLDARRWFAQLTVDEARYEMQLAQTAIAGVLGVIPAGFRTPHFSDSPAVFEAAASVGFHYVSSVTSDRSVSGAPYRVARASTLHAASHLMAGVGEDAFPMTMVPLAPCPDHPGEPFSSYHTVRDDFGVDSPGRGVHRGPGELARLWRRLVEDATGPLCVYFDPLDFSTPSRLNDFGGLLAEAAARGWAFVRMCDLV